MTALCGVAVVVLLVAWCRSCFVAEDLYTARTYVSFPGGLQMQVRVGSSKPGEWLQAGQPCVEHQRGRSISSGYGQLTLWFYGQESTRPSLRHTLDAEPLGPAPTPVDHAYTSKSIDPWTSFQAPRWGPLSNQLIHFHFLGSSIRRGFSQTSFETSEEWRITIPYWMLTIIFCFPLAWQLRKRRKSVPGHCPNCHYDLRASQDRCPECNHPIPAPHNPPPKPPPVEANPPR
jgi:hypothetical protein